MKQIILLAVLSISTATFAKDYQVTGPVIEATDSKFIVDKKGEKFEIARTPSTKVTGDLKVGDKATVYYSMTATEVEVKADPKAKAKKK